MRNLFKNIAIVLLVFLFISGILVLYSTPAQKPKDISLTNLVDQINQGQVKTISVDSNDLTVSLADGTQEKATKEKETGLTESLKNYGVDPQKLQTVDITVKGETAFSSWIGPLIYTLIPFILIAAFIWFMLRQAQRGNTQALSFGLSRARMTDPKDKKKRITFADVAGAKEAKEELDEIVEFLKNPRKIPEFGSQNSQGSIIAWAARHWQNSDRQGGSRRSQCAVFQYFRFGIRGNVCRRRRFAGARSV